MRSILFLAAALGLALPSALEAQHAILTDHFDTYPTGGLTNSAAWPASIPGTDPALSWVTNTGGSQQIVSAPSGRSGNVYSYTENNTGQIYTYSSATLGSAYSGTDNWVLSLDFYLAELSSSSIAPGTFGIAAISNGIVTTSANLLTSVSVNRNSTSGLIQTAVSRSGGSSFFGGNLSLNTWYTLTITGNNATQSMDLRIVGASYDQSLTGLAYAHSLTQFDTVTVGDSVPNSFVAGRSNTAYLDNLSVAVVPEPASVSFLIGGAGLLLACRKRNRQPHVSLKSL